MKGTHLGGRGTACFTYDSCRNDFAVFWLKFSLTRSISNDFGRRTGCNDADLFFIVEDELKKKLKFSVKNLDVTNSF